MFATPRLLLAAALLLGGCAGSNSRARNADLGNPPPDESRPASGRYETPSELPRGELVLPVRLEVPIVARSESHLAGRAIFVEVSDGVEVSIEVKGAPPGKLATHVHERGDCSAADAASAGEHFTPTGRRHGLPTESERHLGDLGNIEVLPDGTGTSDILVRGATLRQGDPNSFLGRAVIVHERQDDGSQPSGNAGGRIGCGVITPG